LVPPKGTSLRDNYLDRAKRETASRTTFSQSEHDWAFAKRALARGEAPEDVIQQIARHRATEKTDPEYYARHTVTKVLAQLKEQTAPTNVPRADEDSSHEA
jgi:hypothetical protein